VRNVVLIGFMGTGKSEVGQLLARRLGWAFIDTDRRIESREQATVAQIFARRGEEHFRAVEAGVVADVAARREVVIGTGGGVVLRPENMMHLRRHGWIVSLTAPVDVLVERLGEAKTRPLLRGPSGGVREQVVRLLDERRPLYRDADLLVDVSDAPPVRVVEVIVAFLRARDRITIPVRLGDRVAPVYVGDGILSLLPGDLHEGGAGRQVVVLSHRGLARGIGARLLGVLKAWGYDAMALDVPVGEASKSLPAAARVYTRLARARIDRASTLIALGGGVIGDLGGFVAATYMRGIRLVQVPTTLLAMVDSSIGGKTGVNHAGAKNLVGAFYQPALTVADVRVLATLPDRELRSGLAEVIKTAVIGDASLFDHLEQHLPAVLRRETAALVEIISRCAVFKARVVEADEREQSERRILNYGHTIGHAVEAAAGFGRLTHGEAVAIGMALEARLAQRLGLAAATVVDRQNALLARAGLPTKLGAVSRRAVWRAMALDKKIRDGVLRCPLPVGIGEVVREQEVPDKLLREVLAGVSTTKRKPSSGARRLRT
jgi:3-dehydroquinate synthase